MPQMEYKSGYQFAGDVGSGDGGTKIPDYVYNQETALDYKYNGKSLYRKTVTFSRSTDSVSLSTLGITNFDDIFIDETMSHIFGNEGAVAYPINYYVSSSNCAQTYVNLNTSTLTTVFKSGFGTTVDYVVTFVYTKS